MDAEHNRLPSNPPAAGLLCRKIQGGLLDQPVFFRKSQSVAGRVSCQIHKNVDLILQDLLDAGFVTLALQVHPAIALA